jgi:hypothetical protein
MCAGGFPTFSAAYCQEMVSLKFLSCSIDLRPNSKNWRRSVFFFQCPFLVQAKIQYNFIGLQKY